MVLSTIALPERALENFRYQVQITEHFETLNLTLYYMESQQRVENRFDYALYLQPLVYDE